MPYKRKESPWWWISYTDASGKRVRQTTGIKKTVAKKLAVKAEIEAQELARQVIPCADKLSIEQVWLEWYKSLSSENHKIRARYASKSIMAFFKNWNIASIKPHHIQQYIEQRREKVKPATVNKETRVLSAIIRRLNRFHGYDLPNPAQGSKLTEDNAVVRWISRDEAKQLIEAAKNSRSKLIAPFIILCLHTGGRKSEVLGLQWDEIDFDNRLLHFTNTVITEEIGGKTYTVPRNKTKKCRSIPMSALVFETLEQLYQDRQDDWVLSNGKTRFRSPLQTFKAVCQKAGINNFRIHDMRHTFASWLVIDGIELAVVRDLLGHKSIQETERYAHLAPHKYRDAINIAFE